MRCDLARNMLSSYLDQGLKDKETRELELHLEQCEPCKELLQELKNTSDFMRNMDISHLPPDLENNLNKCLLHEKVKFFSHSAQEQPNNKGWMITTIAVIAIFIGIHISSLIPALDFLPIPRQAESHDSQKVSALNVDDILQRITERWEKNEPNEEIQETETPILATWKPTAMVGQRVARQQEPPPSEPREVSLESLGIDKISDQFLLAEEHLNELNPDLIYAPNRIIGDVVHNQHLDYEVIKTDDEPDNANNPVEESRDQERKRSVQVAGISGDSGDNKADLSEPTTDDKDEETVLGTGISQEPEQIDKGFQDKEFIKVLEVDKSGWNPLEGDTDQKTETDKSQIQLLQEKED